MIYALETKITSIKVFNWGRKFVLYRDKQDIRGLLIFRMHEKLITKHIVLSLNSLDR